MDDKFDIIEYLSGLTGFVFDKATLKRVALDRGVYEIVNYSDLDSKTKDLLRADLLYTAYISPNVWASSTQSHGSYSKTIGQQTLYSEDKKRIYNEFIRIYTEYDDPKVQDIEPDGGMEWLDM